MSETQLLLNILNALIIETECELESATIQSRMDVPDSVWRAQIGFLSVKLDRLRARRAKIATYPQS